MTADWIRQPSKFSDVEHLKEGEKILKRTEYSITSH
jgi:hypothetical protein